MEKVDPIFP